jgi:hypothetical protein
MHPDRRDTQLHYQIERYTWGKLSARKASGAEV